MWHEQSISESPEVMLANMESDEWRLLATDFSADVRQISHPRYEEFLSTGILTLLTWDDCRKAAIQRSGNIPVDVERCIEALRAFFLSDFSNEIGHVVYHTVSMEPPPKPFAAVGLSAAEWDLEPRPTHLLPTAVQVGTYNMFHEEP